MKLNINRKKLRFGGIALALTAFIIAAVVLLNVLFYSLAVNNRWFIDMTSESLFTLSDECRDLVKNALKGKEGEADKEVTIYFCDDPDNLTANTYMNYVYTTVLDLADACKSISVEYLNYEYNPSSVQRFMQTGASINSQSIIVESGTEYRTYTLKSMFVVNDDDTIWAYNGEKRLAGAILAVTSVDQPIAFITTSHGEQYEDEALFSLLNDAGYKLLAEGSKDDDGNLISLKDKKNPLDDDSVRLVVVYNPKIDFQTEGVNELERIDRYLEKSKSIMVFMDANSPTLPDFEEWLATWGVVFDRYKENNKLYSYMINDTASSLDDAGYKIRANYLNSGKLVYSGILDNGSPASVYFENSTSISYAKNYSLVMYENDEDSSQDFRYGSYYVDGVSKEIFDLFTASSLAIAQANGKTVAGGSTTSENPFKLMTLTRRPNTIQETNYITTTENAYVLACGSTKFATSSYLDSAVYGNSDILLAATVLMGREVVPVGIEFKPFASFDISDLTEADANRYTLLLAILPPIFVIGTGIVVLVRRKNS